MCGRVVSKIDFPTLQRITRTNLSRRSCKYTKSYNIGPGCFQAALIHSRASISLPIEETQECEKTHTERVLSVVKWGFRLSASKKLVFNIRAETIAVKFSSLAASRRCVILASGYYEWTSSHQPYYLSTPSCPILYLAGVYIEEEGDLKSAILTKQAPERLAWLHERVPCILTESDVERWLDEENSFKEVVDAVLGDRIEEVGLTWHPVANLVNVAGKEGEDLCIPLEEWERKTKENGILRYFKPVEKREREKKGEETAVGGKRAKVEDKKSSTPSK